MEDNIFLIEEGINISSLPEVTVIDNFTYCFKPDLWAFVKCFPSNNTEEIFRENRTTFGTSSTEFCLDDTGEFYIVCEPFQPLYQVSSTVTALLTIFYVLIALIAFIGNCLVMYVVCVSRRMQTVTNYYISALALSDVVLALFCIPFQFRAALMQRWDLPEFMCQFCPFMQTLSVNASVWTLVAICLDRYQAIVNPLAKKASKTQARLVILGIWLTGSLLALPMGAAHTFQLVLDGDNGGLKPFCSVRWSSLEAEAEDAVETESMLLTMFQVYCVIVVVLEYVVPLSVIIVAYLRMAIKLWWAVTPGQADRIRDDKILRNKKRVLHMMLIVVVVFSLCWAPWQVYLVASIIHPSINTWKYVNIMFFAFHWLAMSSSCYNPFIYGIYSEKFKREFRIRLTCSIFGAPTSPNESIEMQEIRQIMFSARTQRRLSSNRSGCVRNQNSYSDSHNHVIHD